MSFINFLNKKNITPYAYTLLEDEEQTKLQEEYDNIIENNYKDTDIYKEYVSIFTEHKIPLEL